MLGKVGNGTEVTSEDGRHEVSSARCLPCCFLKLPWLSDEVGLANEWIKSRLIQVVRRFVKGAGGRWG